MNQSAPQIMQTVERGKGVSVGLYDIAENSIPLEPQLSVLRPSDTAPFSAFAVNKQAVSEILVLRNRLLDTYSI